MNKEKVEMQYYIEAARSNAQKAMIEMGKLLVYIEEGYDVADNPDFHPSRLTVIIAAIDQYNKLLAHMAQAVSTVMPRQ